VTVWTGRDDTDIIWVLNGSDDTSSENEFFPGLSNVENMNTWIMKDLAATKIMKISRHTIRTSFPDVRLHLLIAVFCADMALRS
jgi:hypothetical protein